MCTTTHTSRTTIMHSTAQHSTAQHSIAQHSTAQHSTAHHNTTQHNTAQHSTTQYSTLPTTVKYIACTQKVKDMQHVHHHVRATLHTYHITLILAAHTIIKITHKARPGTAHGTTSDIWQNQQSPYCVNKL
jgi:hypothetical protein